MSAGGAAPAAGGGAGVGAGEGIRAVGVVGAGVMGTGIAQCCALAGLDVLVCDTKDEFVAASRARMAKSLDRAVERGKCAPEQKEAALARVSGGTDLLALAAADLVIEAVVEDLEAKRGVFARLGAAAKPSAIFATNTSSLSVTAIAGASGRPERFLGIHFFNPVHAMRLVEVVRGERTGGEAMEAALAFARRIGKVPVAVRKDSPGFIVNRLLLPYLNEAARLVSEGVASPEDVDTAVKLGLNHPMGPFELLDMSGPDLAITILEYFAREFGDPGYSPRLLLRQMTRAGKTGRKAGEGFYKYDGKDK